LSARTAVRYGDANHGHLVREAHNKGVGLPVLPERQLAARATAFDHANFSAGIRRRATIRHPGTQRRG
jgi:hypothetical protein